MRAVFQDKEILRKLDKIEQDLLKVQTRLGVLEGKVDALAKSLTNSVDALTKSLIRAVSEAAERVISEQRDMAMKEILEEVAKLKAEREVFEAYRMTIADYSRFREQVEGELVKLRSELQLLLKEREGGGSEDSHS